MYTPRIITTTLILSGNLFLASPAAAQATRVESPGWERLTDSVHVWPGSIRRDAAGRYHLWMRKVASHGIFVRHYQVDCAKVTAARTPTQVVTTDGYRTD